MDGFKLEPVVWVQKGFAGVRALLCRAGNDALRERVQYCDAGGAAYLLRAGTMERAEENIYLFMVGLLHRGSGRLARRRLGSDLFYAATHLSDSYEEAGAH